MQYIQTSQESYLFSVIEGLVEAYSTIDLELPMDTEEFDQYLENEDLYSMFNLLCTLENIHKLDK